MKLKDRVALITGSGSGFGRTIARQMAAEGACIAVNDINPDGIEKTLSMLKENGAQAIGLQADVGNVDQVRAMFEELVSRWGTLDILVNNAGFSARADWKEFTDAVNATYVRMTEETATLGKAQDGMRVTSSFKDEYWHSMIDVHLNGTFYCTREALKIMEEKRRGKIINMASICGMQGCPGAPSYSAAKGGIIAFTKSVALEVIASGINVNAVAPGYVDTPLLDTMSPEVKAIITSRKPIGRMGKPGEIANAVVFLSTDDADFFVGQVISPNGGMVV
ncbi:MAG: SDR family NAD(P)-dependent oxidoreductase [Desulfobacterales bacterium]